MATETQSQISNKTRVLREMARYLSMHLHGSDTAPAGKLLATYKKAGVFRRALIGSLTADDIHRLCDATIGPGEKGISQQYRIDRP